MVPPMPMVWMEMSLARSLAVWRGEVPSLWRPSEKRRAAVCWGGLSGFGGLVGFRLISMRGFCVFRWIGRWRGLPAGDRLEC